MTQVEYDPEAQMAIPARFARASTETDDKEPYTSKYFIRYGTPNRTALRPTESLSDQRESLRPSVGFANDHEKVSLSDLCQAVHESPDEEDEQPHRLSQADLIEHKRRYYLRSRVRSMFATQKGHGGVEDIALPRVSRRVTISMPRQSDEEEDDSCYGQFRRRGNASSPRRSDCNPQTTSYSSSVDRSHQGRSHPQSPSNSGRESHRSSLGAALIVVGAGALAGMISSETRARHRDHPRSRNRDGSHHDRHRSDAYQHRRHSHRRTFEDDAPDIRALQRRHTHDGAHYDRDRSRHTRSQKPARLTSERHEHDDGEGYREQRYEREPDNSEEEHGLPRRRNKYQASRRCHSGDETQTEKF